MKIFKKFYIGKGKQVEGLNIAKCTCRLEDLENIQLRIRRRQIRHIRSGYNETGR